MTGKDGNDTVAVAPGIDLIAGLFGNNGNDTLTGGAGNDDIEGGQGNDTLNGGPGNDRFFPSYGSDTMNGGSGNDYAEQQSLSGDADVFNGEADDDALWTQGSGASQFNGGAGDDLLMHSSFYSPDVVAEVSGGEGEDEAAFGSGLNQPVAVSLDDQANDGAPGTGTSNVHSDVENIDTDSGADIIVGSPGPNVIRSDVSRDRFYVLPTAGGNDTVDPGGGADQVYSGGGNDTIAAADQLGDLVNCGSNSEAPPDSDTVTGDSIDTFFSCENVNAIPLPDITPPNATIGAPKSISRRAFARRGLTLELGADEAASFAVELNAKVKRRGGGLAFPAAVGEATIGTGRLKLGTGTRKLRLKPSKRFAASVRSRRLRVVIRVTAKDAAGNVTRAARSVRVK